MHLLPCRPWPATQSNSWPLNLRSAFLFLLPLPPSVCSPFYDINFAMYLSTPVVDTFLVPPFHHHWLKPIPYPAGLNLQPGPCRSLGYLHIKSLVSCPSLLCATSSPALVLPHLLMYSGGFYLFSASFCALTRGQGACAPWRFLTPTLVPALLGRDGAIQPPPTSAYCPLDTIPVSWYWWGAALERNHSVCCHYRGYLDC